MKNRFKIFRSNEFNYNFDKKTGYTEFWGKTTKTQDDPKWCKYGPVIADIEISTICGKNCPFCYKGNTPGKGKNMSFEEFKRIFHMLPKTLTQIAFGIGDLQDIDTDMWKIFKYCRNNDYQEVIPNLTINGRLLTDEKIEILKELMGAVCVSHYDDDECYNAVKKLTDAGMQQINIHQLLSKETFQQCLDVMKDKINDERLKKLNSIVFLALKKKDRGVGFNNITKEQYSEIIDFAISNNIPIGFDSCSANFFAKEYSKKNKDINEINRVLELIEPCESTLFSCYFNTDSKFFPCSFCEGEGEWKEGIELKDNFIKDIWHNNRTHDFRNKCLNCNRECVMFDVNPK